MLDVEYVISNVVGQIGIVSLHCMRISLRSWLFLTAIYHILSLSVRVHQVF